MDSEQTLRIDNRDIVFLPGETIMQAALRADYYIPHLCYHPEVSPHGSCRLCMVKVNGRYMPACTTPASGKQIIESDSEEINGLRKRLTQMLFVEGNHLCPYCEVSGQCQLQASAYVLEMDDLHYPAFHPTRSLDASHPDLVIDRDRCIDCALCVRASDQLDRKQALGLGGRGINTYLIANSDDGSLAHTAMAAADRAAHICPVGAILPKTGNYSVPIGRRLYDREPITLVGNLRADSLSEKDAPHGKR